MLNHLKHTQKRTYQYWFVDGLVELSSGFFLIFLALYFWLQAIFPSSGLVSMLFIVVNFIIAYGVRRLLERIKERNTYPRTGYIAYHKSWGNQRDLTVILGFTILVGAINLYLVLRGPAALNWMPAVGGLILGFIFLWNGYKSALLRHFSMALFCMLAGVGIAFAGLGGMTGTALLFALAGILSLILGFWNRWSYLHHTPSITEVDHGN